MTEGDRASKQRFEANVASGSIETLTGEGAGTNTDSSFGAKVGDDGL